MPMKYVVALVLAAFALTAGAQELGPDELVRKVTAEVLEAIQNDKQLQAGDRKKALALAEQKILPLVDFREATRLAVGRAWNTATPEQQEGLTTQFRTLLVRIYSNAVGVYRGQTMRVQPAKMVPGATEVSVRNQYLSPGRPPTTVEYAMHKTPTGWKIYDITVEGVSLVLTYRGEFGQIVREGGVDGLIQRLAERNREPAR
jgi:phospholipid transport system substrate-binding protein